MFEPAEREIPVPNVVVKAPRVLLPLAEILSEIISPTTPAVEVGKITPSTSSVATAPRVSISVAVRAFEVVRAESILTTLPMVTQDAAEVQPLYVPGAASSRVLALTAAVRDWPVRVFCTVMLEELKAVTVPVKSPIVSNAPEGVPVRGVVIAVKVFGCVKSTPMLVVVGEVMALLRLTSIPIHAFSPEVSVRLIGILIVAAAPVGRLQTPPFGQVSEEDTAIVEPE